MSIVNMALLSMILTVVHMVLILGLVIMVLGRYLIVEYLDP